MKRNPITIFLGVAALSAGCFASTSGFAITASQVEGIKSALSLASVPEMPATAAQLVSAAKADEREGVAQAAVRAVLETKPALAGAMVNAIAKTSPDVAAATAVAAAVKQPKQIGIITKAAVSGAPTRAGSIVAALCKQFPAKYNLIALAADEAAPLAGKEILNAVAANVPFVSLFIESTIGAAGSQLSVAKVISDTDKMVADSAATLKSSPDQLLAPAGTLAKASTAPEQHFSAIALPAPTVAPPYVAPSGSPTTISSTNTVVVDPGAGRNYSY